jgi:DNA-binding PadR family transcriptional regulator
VEAGNRELVQGTLEMLAFKTLALEWMHGYGIALRIEQTSSGVFRVHPGSLLPALSRRGRSGRILGEWPSTEKQPRRQTLAPERAIGAAKSWLLSGFLKPEEEKCCGA